MGFVGSYHMALDNLKRFFIILSPQTLLLSIINSSFAERTNHTVAILENILSEVKYWLKLHRITVHVLSKFRAWLVAGLFVKIDVKILATLTFNQKLQAWFNIRQSGSRATIELQDTTREGQITTKDYFNLVSLKFPSIQFLF